MQNSDFLGFTSPSDVAAGIFGHISKFNMNNILLISLLSGFIPFIEQWVWSPFWTLMLFTAVFCLDFVAAVLVSFHEEEVNDGGSKVIKGFQTNKALRFLITLFASWIILAFAFNMEKLNEVFGAGFINGKLFEGFATVLYVGWLLLNFASAIKHLSRLGFVPEPVAKFFIKYIDTHKAVLMKETKAKFNNNIQKQDQTADTV